MSKFSGMPSCSCEVSAATWDVSSHPNSSTLGTAITEVVAVQARLWKGGAWKVKNIVARKSMEITEVLFQEDLGHSAGNGDVSLDTSAAKDSQHILLHPTCNSWFQIYDCFLKGRVLVWVNSGRYHIITRFAVPLVYQVYILPSVGLQSLSLCNPETTH